jgi:GNAT superfamily N-acetyltransferase
MLAREVDPEHGKRRILTLTAAGRVAFTALDHGSRYRMEAVLSPLATAHRRKLKTAMRDIQAAFDAPQDDAGPVVLRSLVPGDLGWVIHRQATLYAQQYGWDWTYEALISKILGEFATAFDAAKEDGWIAERGGHISGSIFLMKSEDPDVAKLRLLYVVPSARGSGIGRRLVESCIDRARELGYRRLTLWTNDILVAARRIYENEGFRLTSEYEHRSFGHNLVGQTWDLDLEPPPTAVEKAKSAG